MAARMLNTIALCRRRQPAVITRDQDQGMTVRSKLSRQLQPDAARCSGNERGAARHILLRHETSLAGAQD